MKRRLSLLLLATAMAALAGCDSKPTITLICPWSAGGGTDSVSRYFAGALEKELDQRVVVSNKTGGSGATGHSAGAKARPDGATITMITFELSTMKQMGINAPTWEDFRPLLQVNGDAAAIVVKNDAPWQTLGELLDDIKKRGESNKVVMSGTATGGAWDLARAGLQQAADIPIEYVAWKPNNGAAPSLTDLLGGHVEVLCCSVPEVKSQLDEGEVRVLAVLADERLEKYPDIPTAKEQGVDWSAIGWRGLAVPKETPNEVVERLSAACRKIAESEGYQEFMAKPGYSIVIRGPDEFAEFLKSQETQWKPVIQAAGYDKAQ